jgi:hypothetical protein
MRSRANRLAVSTMIVRTLALDPLEHGREARTCIDGIGAAHGRVVEVLDQLITALEANAAKVSRCRQSLSLSAPTLAADEVLR